MSKVGKNHSEKKISFPWQEKPSFCFVCNKIFINTNSFEEHNGKLHRSEPESLRTGVVTLKCEPDIIDTSENFVESADLVAGEIKVDIIPCNYCSLTFESEGILNDHQELEHTRDVSSSNNLKPHQEIELKNIRSQSLLTVSYTHLRAPRAS